MYFHPLNFIRFVLAIGVVLFHYGVNYFPFNLPILKTLILNSTFRVSFFFFISGFVMYLVYAKKWPNLHALLFYKMRFTRIFPVYWLAFILTLIVVLFVVHASPKGLVIILHFFGLQSLYPGFVLDLNYTTWSISVELIFYLFFPFILKWMMVQSNRKLIIITIIIWLLQSLQHIILIEYLNVANKTSMEFISSFPLWHFSTFFVGMVTSRFVIINPHAQLFKKHALSGLLTSVLLFALIIFIPNPILKYIHNGLLSPLFMLLIVSLYYDTSFITKLLSVKQVSNLGNLSYGLFIFQYPVWVICTKIVNPYFIESSWFFPSYLSSLIALAWIVNKIYEKPIMLKLRK